MPAPLSSLSTDQFIYDYVCNPLARHICFIHPNVISIIGFLITFPIIYNLITHQHITILILFVLAKTILDCLDGAVARACNKTSKIGKYLDITCDAISQVMIGTAVWYILSSTPIWWIAPLYIIQSCVNFLMFVYNANKNAIEVENIYLQILHDNTVLINVIGFVVAKLLIIHFLRP